MAIPTRKPITVRHLPTAEKLAARAKREKPKIQFNKGRVESLMAERISKKNPSMSPERVTEAAKAKTQAYRKTAAKKYTRGQKLEAQQKQKSFLKAAANKAYKLRLAKGAYNRFIKAPLSNLAGWGRYRQS